MIESEYRKLSNWLKWTATLRAKQQYHRIRLFHRTREHTEHNIPRQFQPQKIELRLSPLGSGCVGKRIEKHVDPTRELAAIRSRNPRRGATANRHVSHDIQFHPKRIGCVRVFAPPRFVEQKQTSTLLPHFDGVPIRRRRRKTCRTQ